MKIINELSYSQIKNNKKDTLATKLSIFLAVVLLGTVIFIIGSIKTEEYRRITSTAGDYQVSIGIPWAEKIAANSRAAIDRKSTRLNSSHHAISYAVFTFAVDGLSRIASHQLVRHRMASFSQQSQR